MDVIVGCVEFFLKLFKHSNGFWFVLKQVDFDFAAFLFLTASGEHCADQKKCRKCYAKYCSLLSHSSFSPFSETSLFLVCLLYYAKM